MTFALNPIDFVASVFSTSGWWLSQALGCRLSENVIHQRIRDSVPPLIELKLYLRVLSRESANTNKIANPIGTRAVGLSIDHRVVILRRRFTIVRLMRDILPSILLIPVVN